MTNGLVYLTYNSAHEIGRYWHTIPRGAKYPLRVKVIDNGSTDSTIEVMDKLGMKYTVNKTNNGYTAGINQGIKDLIDSDVEWIFLCNPDVACVDGWDTIVDELTPNDKVGIIGARLVSRMGLHHCGGIISENPATVYWNFLEDIGDGYQISEQRGICTTRFWHARRELHEPTKVPWVTFAFVALRRAMVQDIGLLDERYFLYSSDAQYCMRAWAAGWEVWCNPLYTFWHDVSVSLRSADDRVQQLAVADIRRFAHEEETSWLQLLSGQLPKKT